MKTIKRTVVIEEEEGRLAVELRVDIGRMTGPEDPPSATSTIYHPPEYYVDGRRLPGDAFDRVVAMLALRGGWRA